MSHLMINGVVHQKAAHCEEHGAYTSYQLELGGPVWTDCPLCSEQAVKNENRRIADSQQDDLNRQRGEAMFNNAGIPRRHQQSALSSYECGNDQQRGVCKAVCDYARNIETNVESGNGLIMLGQMGTGKTHLAIGLIRVATRNNRVASKYITAPSLFTRVRASYSSREESEQEILSEMTSIPLLVIDEIGTGKGSANEVDILNAVLTQRYDDCRPTVIISNLQPAELKEWLGDRVVDRLKETSPVILFNWESHRGQS